MGGFTEPVEQIEERILTAENAFIREKMIPAKYLLMSIAGYQELLHDLAVKNTEKYLDDITGDEIDEEESFYLNGINSYKGLSIYVSQDMESPDFVLSA